MATNWTAAQFDGQDYGKIVQGAKSAQDVANWYNRYNYKSPAETAAAAAPKAPVDPALPPPPTANNVGTQAGNAQTYSNTPGSAPTQNTTNQGTQDVLRNKYLQQVVQGTSIDAQNDPNIRQQSDAFGAAQERARRDQASDIAEKFAGSGQTGAQNVETRLLNERASQGRASFEADLVGRELQTRRDEINNAMSQLGGMLSDDQNRALQKELANIDAQLKKAGISSSEALGRAELALKDKLGMGGLNVDLARLLQGNQQFNKDLGFRIGDREASLNQQALLSLLR